MKSFFRSFWSVLSGGSVALTLHAHPAIPFYSFPASGTNGASPEGSLAVGLDGNFYGTTETGGVFTNGTIYKITPSGVETTLVSFTGTNGANPLAGLALGPDGNFYGTTEYGGSTIGTSNVNDGLGGGTVFRVTPDGTLTTLVNFAATNGATPRAGLTFGPDGNLYGTTSAGGPNGLAYGTLFRMTPAGTLTTLTNFNGSNGSLPYAGLTLAPDGNFYGTTQSGGTHGSGTIFRLTINGVLTPLYSFDVTNGISPQTTLIVGADGALYGTTSQSFYTLYTVFPGFTINVPSGNGTIFQFTTNGSVTLVANFDNQSAGVYPNGNLTADAAGNLYGTTYWGGDYGVGTVYQVMTNWTLITLANFNNTNGAYAIAGLTFGADHNLYGGTTGGGAGGNGTLFKFALPPYSLALAPGTNSFTLFADGYPDTTNRIWATTNLASASAWQVLGSVITDADGLAQLIDTNTAGLSAKYYRLSYP